jgi:hypothetical protein
MWGSAVSGSGKEVKACNDVKKIAVILAGLDTSLLMRIPPASLKNWKTMCQLVATHGANLNMMTLRVRFDPQVQGVLLFEPIDWIDQPMAQRIMALEDSKLAVLTGRNDVVKQGALPAPAAAPVPQIAAPVPQPAPAPFIPAAPAPQPFMAAQAPAAPAPQRRRRTKAEIEADAIKAGLPAPAPSAATSPPPFLNAAPAPAPVEERFGMQAAPEIVSDASLDAMISNAMNLPI